MKLPPNRVQPLWWLLRIIESASGTVDACESKYSWLNAFCDDFDEDTFNLAERLGLIRTTHNSDTDHSTATLLPAGRAFIVERKAQ